jgi:hypothetical protein
MRMSAMGEVDPVAHSPPAKAAGHFLLGAGTVHRAVGLLGDRLGGRGGS